MDQSGTFGTSKLSAVVANDLSGLLGTAEVVSNVTNRGITGDSDIARLYYRRDPAQAVKIPRL